MRINDDILKMNGWDAPVRNIDGIWWRAVELNPLRVGCRYYAVDRHGNEYVATYSDANKAVDGLKVPLLGLILEPAEVPPVPGSEWLDKQNAGRGYKYVLGDLKYNPDLYVTCPRNGPPSVAKCGGCNTDVYSGLRWEVMRVPVADIGVSELDMLRGQAKAWEEVHQVCTELDMYNRLERLCENGSERVCCFIRMLDRQARGAADHTSKPA